MFKEIAHAIAQSENITILPHKSADGDCLGSAFALKLMLEYLGKNAVVQLEEVNTRICSILFGTIQNTQHTCETVIAVDCGDISRLGKRVDIFKHCQNTINIDHHDTNERYAKYNYVDVNAAATGEIIFELAEYMNIPITQQIANNIYTAISSDTGCFSYNSTTSKTYRIAAKLLETGINHAFINEVLFERNSISKIKLMGMAYNSFETFQDGKIAMVSITKQQALQSGAEEEDMGGLINIARSLDTAQVAISLRESTKENSVKIGFRSNSINVAEIAAELGGGGHIRASGCSIKGDIASVKQIVLKQVIKTL